MLTQKQQKEYLSGQLIYTPKLTPDGYLMIDYFINQKNESMKRIWNETFISTSSIQFPDLKGFIETKKVKLKVNDNNLRFCFGSYCNEYNFESKLIEILSRLKMSHLWMFCKTFYP